ncbi:hypothetical protein R5W24_005143 [Gemmata sp. JC717]|uniref:WD40 repeat domain-containing protein n=1 Tax=Gemmata algarum TaxID=2975278 RepID=UPI0021BAB99C|nr:hypothetical protein [Gemmata algarum]MDY3555995.1 hypothetical protein [Gemmata algarum]
MSIFDKRLIDPDEGALAGALGRAMRAANRDNRYQDNRMSRDAAFWGRFSQDVLRSGGPAGRRRSCKGGRAVPEVIAGWWTDPAGRKHVRVIGRTRSRYSRTRSETQLRVLPPWWHVYPEAVLGVRGARDDSERYVAACRCGAIGTPESLGWMGDTCGPCFDQLSDGGRPAGGFGQFAGWSANLTRFGFTTDGRGLLGQGLSGAFRTVSRADGSEVTGRKRLSNHISAIASGTGGPVVALHDGGIYRWDDGTADLEHVLRSRQVWGRVALAPNATRLTLVAYQQALTADLTADRPQYERSPAVEGVSSLRYTPDGKRLIGLTFTGELRELDVARGKAVPIRAGAFGDQPGGYAPSTEFALTADGSAALVRRQSYNPHRVLVRHVPLAGGPVVELKVPDWHQPTALAYSIDGAHAVTAETESGWVGFWDVSNGKALGFVRAVLEDHAWRGGQAEFAPDGSAVAVSYSTGHPDHGSTVAVWPWPHVLRAAGA